MKSISRNMMFQSTISSVDFGPLTSCKFWPYLAIFSLIQPYMTIICDCFSQHNFWKKKTRACNLSPFQNQLLRVPMADWKNFRTLQNEDLLKQCFLVVNRQPWSYILFFGHYFRDLLIPTFMVATIFILIGIIFLAIFCFVQLFLTIIVGHLQEIGLRFWLRQELYRGHTTHFIDTANFSYFIKWDFCKKKAVLQYSLKSCPMTQNLICPQIRLTKTLCDCSQLKWDTIRRLVGSTHQACSSGFYFRIV